MSQRLEMLLEKARRIINEAEETNILEPAPEIHVYDFDLTLQHKYKPLPLVDQLREHWLAEVPVYIVTAREPNKGQEDHIQQVLSWWDIKLPIENIICVGAEADKGPFVLELIQRHEPNVCVFWDDKIENCESVFSTCSESVDVLQVFHLSKAVPGDIRKEIRKDEENERVEIKHTLEERKLFRNWRRLGRI